jgi:hypothetical protein
VDKRSKSMIGKGISFDLTSIVAHSYPATGN